MKLKNMNFFRKFQTLVNWLGWLIIDLYTSADPMLLRPAELLTFSMPALSKVRDPDWRPRPSHLPWTTGRNWSVFHPAVVVWPAPNRRWPCPTSRNRHRSARDLSCNNHQLMYPLVMSKSGKVDNYETCSFIVSFPIKKMIFDRYVSLPEDMLKDFGHRIGSIST